MKPKTFTILCVDDEPEICAFIAEELAAAGFKTLRASSGREACELVRRHAVDLVLTDYRMPEGDGMDLLRALRSDPAAPPVVLLTGYADFAAGDAYREGVEAVFTKPVDYDALVGFLRRTLSGSDQKTTRAHERFFASGRVSLSFPTFGEAREGNLLNISRGGMFLASVKPLPLVRDEVDFAIAFADARLSPMDGRAVCRWVRGKPGDEPMGAGFEFVSLSEPAFRNLQKLLELLRATPPRKGGA